MPNWVKLRLTEKARSANTDSIFQNIEKTVYQKRDQPRLESVAEFLARGGKIKHLSEKRR